LMLKLSQKITLRPTVIMIEWKPRQFNNWSNIHQQAICLFDLL
jgi:hypothetical protein